MAGWTEHQGQAVALPVHNIDTDQLIPARFMSTPRSEGYGQFLLHDLRRLEGGSECPDFPLNQFPQASVLIAGRNFGSGSSREAAVYALVDAGFRAVVAPSFGDIFASNAVNNGLLPALVSEADLERLTGELNEGGGSAHIHLEHGHIIVGGSKVPFSLDNSWRTKLINGWDDIDLTLQHELAIEKHKQDRRTTSSWVWPNAEDQNSQVNGSQ